jgi:hypothetical protein
MKKLYIASILFFFPLTFSSCTSDNESLEAESTYLEDIPETEQSDLMHPSTIKGSDEESDFEANITYPIVDTGVTSFYNNSNVIEAPTNKLELFYGQDAWYQSHPPSYTENGDGTITDNTTGLMWQIDMGDKVAFNDTKSLAQQSNLGGYDDWRVPTIKELYSLILFTGRYSPEGNHVLYIDERFNQPFGDTSAGEREIDAQTWSSTIYVSTTMNGDQTVFGVNFIDGRIKGYPIQSPRNQQDNMLYLRLVRGNENYGNNAFIDNDDETVSDTATGLMWMKNDSSEGMIWQDALSYCETRSDNYDDWRLPNAKELQSIVDYTRSPETTNSPAIDEIFVTTPIIDPNGDTNYPYFWTSTTHLDGADPESGAVYISFGEALGKINGQVFDVHGAGAQRSDPKTGSPDQYPQYFGPQGDLRYVFNYVRCVREI